jgi:hypothetical protein
MVFVPPAKPSPSAARRSVVGGLVFLAGDVAAVL